MYGFHEMVKILLGTKPKVNTYNFHFNIVILLFLLSLGAHSQLTIFSRERESYHSGWETKISKLMLRTYVMKLPYTWLPGMDIYSKH